MLFGNVWEESEVTVNSLDLNFDLQQARFFLGDHWIPLGSIPRTTTKDKHGLIISVNMDVLDQFLLERMAADDGTDDWLEWGPRVN